MRWCITGEGGAAAVRGVGAFMGAQIKIEWKDVGEVSKVISPKVGVVVGCHPE